MALPPVLHPSLFMSPVPARRVVAVAASTGGPSALTHLLSRLPAELPAGVIVVQHMPAGGFTRALAERLDGVCALKVREAQHGDPVALGQVLIAPAGCHLRVSRLRGAGVVLLDRGPAVNNHRPSADVLFESVARAFGARAVGVVLTGMGEDGAEGLHALRQAGGRTLAQDEQSSVVFGMPRAAVRRGAVDRVLPLEELARAVVTEADRAEAHYRWHHALQGANSQRM